MYVLYYYSLLQFVNQKSNIQCITKKITYHTNFNASLKVKCDFNARLSSRCLYNWRVWKSTGGSADKRTTLLGAKTNASKSLGQPTTYDGNVCSNCPENIIIHFSLILRVARGFIDPLTLSNLSRVASSPFSSISGLFPFVIRWKELREITL